MEDSRRRYSTFAKSLIFGIQMIASVLMAVCAVILDRVHQSEIFFPASGVGAVPMGETECVDADGVRDSLAVLPCVI